MMEDITWKNTDRTGRRFDFEIGSQLLGRLTLFSELSSNAMFITNHDSIRFKRIGLWENKVLVQKNDVVVGEICNRVIGQTFLTVQNGSTFSLSSNFLGRNLKWLDSRGVPVVEYSMATLRSLRKGLIRTSDSLSREEKEILLGAGLIAGRFNTYRLTFLILALAFAANMISKFI